MTMFGDFLSHDAGAGSYTPPSPKQISWPLYCIVYVSAANASLSAGQLEELLEQSRHRNRQLGITGMMIHLDGNFMQAIEGPEAAVKDLFNRIQSDRRHSGVITLLREYTDHRRFPEWAMGYRDIHSAQSGDWEAVHRILEAARIGEQAADNGPLNLLARFGETMGFQTMGFEAGGHEAGGYEEAGSFEVAA
jgi:hypothetical protein